MSDRYDEMVNEIKRDARLVTLRASRLDPAGQDTDADMRGRIGRHADALLAALRERERTNRALADMHEVDRERLASERAERERLEARVTEMEAENARLKAAARGAVQDAIVGGFEMGVKERGDD